MVSLVVNGTNTHTHTQTGITWCVRAIFFSLLIISSTNSGNGKGVQLDVCHFSDCIDVINVHSIARSSALCIFQNKKNDLFWNVKNVRISTYILRFSKYFGHGSSFDHVFHELNSLRKKQPFSSCEPETYDDDYYNWKYLIWPWAPRACFRLFIMCSALYHIFFVLFSSPFFFFSKNENEGDCDWITG